MFGKSHLIILPLIALGFISASTGYAENTTSHKVTTSQEKSSSSNISPHPLFNDQLEKEFLSSHFQEFKKIKQDMDKLFDEALTRFDQDQSLKDMFNSTYVTNNLDMNLKNQNNQYIITMNLPNAQKNDVDVKVQDQRLTISGRVSEQIETKGKQSSEFKQFTSNFTRSIILPSKVKPETLKTNFTDNKLKVTIDKA